MFKRKHNGEVALIGAVSFHCALYVLILFCIDFHPNLLWRLYGECHFHILLVLRTAT